MYAICIWGLVIFFSLENNFFCMAEVADLAVAEVAEAETEKSHGVQRHKRLGSEYRECKGVQRVKKAQ